MPKHLTVNDSDDFLQPSQLGQPNGVAGLDGTGKIPVGLLPDVTAGVSSVNGHTGAVVLAAADVGALADDIVGVNNGVAPLDAVGRLPVSRLPTTALVADGSGKLPVAQLPTVAVQSVNGQSGPSVTLAASDVGALTQTAGDARYLLQSARGAASGVASLDSGTKVPTAQIPDMSATYVPLSQKGAALGVATLDSGGLVPTSQLPATSSAVTSVNSQTGAVVLTAANVGAVATTAVNAANGVAGLDASSKLSGSQQLYSSTGTIVAIGSANAGGSATSAARGDHVHAGVTSVNGSQGVVTVTPANISAVATSAVGAASGVASLDSGTKVPVAQIPTLAYLPTAGGSLTGTVTSTGGTSAAVVAAAIVSGDAFDRWRLTADGGLAAGPGTVTRDTTMVRSGVGEWTMNGKLVLGADPTAALGVATKQYVDTLSFDQGPADQGLIAWTADPAGGADVGQPATGAIRLARIILRKAATITNIWCSVSVAGATLTANQCLLGLYQANGTRVGVTANQATAWTTTGVKSAALTGTYAAAAGIYYVAFLAVGTTIPSFFATSAPSLGPTSANLTVSTGRFLSGPTAQTSMPATITMSSNTLNYTAYWAALN